MAHPHRQTSRKNLSALRDAQGPWDGDGLMVWNGLEWSGMVWNGLEWSLAKVKATLA